MSLNLKNKNKAKSKNKQEKLLILNYKTRKFFKESTSKINKINTTSMIEFVWLILAINMIGLTGHILQLVSLFLKLSLI